MSVATVAVPVVPAPRRPLQLGPRPSRRLEWASRPSPTPMGPSAPAVVPIRPVRLTRRGRRVRAALLLVAAGCVLVGLAMGFLGGGSTVASATAVSAAPGAAAPTEPVAPAGPVGAAGAGSARPVATEVPAPADSRASVPRIRTGTLGAVAVAPPTADVVVHAGESLWEVAARIAPARDPREVVLRLREANGLTTPVVHPGQQLLVPAGLG